MALTWKENASLVRIVKLTERTKHELKKKFMDRKPPYFAVAAAFATLESWERRKNIRIFFDSSFLSGLWYFEAGAAVR